jgi:hypothetical protein
MGIRPASSAQTLPAINARHPAAAIAADTTVLLIAALRGE